MARGNNRRGPSAAEILEAVVAFLAVLLLVVRAVRWFARPRDGPQPSSAAAQGPTGAMGFTLFDPLFAVVVGVGFEYGVIKKPFFENPGLILEPPFDVAFWVMVMGYLLVVSSWVGYHKSTDAKPITTIWRFYIDVVLLGMYLLLLVKYENLGLTHLLLVSIFGAYVVWDAVKQMEYPDHDRTATLRRGVTVFWLLYFGVVFIVFRLFGGPSGLFVGLQLGGVIGFRLHKVWAWPPKLLRALSALHEAVVISLARQIIRLPKETSAGG